MKGYFEPVIPKVSLLGKRSLLRRITECQLAAALLQRRADLAKVGGKAVAADSSAQNLRIVFMRSL
jgi:hypothetical protein